MAAVLKRRRNEDPVEILKVSCKRRKNDDGDAAFVEENDRNEVESLLKFAATIQAKDTSISKHIRDAIRKEKLQKEYKQHTYNGDIIVRKRQERQPSSQSSHYKVLTSYRSLGLDDLDAATTNECRTEQNGDNKKENNNKTTGTADIQRANNTEEISNIQIAVAVMATVKHLTNPPKLILKGATVNKKFVYARTQVTVVQFVAQNLQVIVQNIQKKILLLFVQLQVKLRHFLLAPRLFSEVNQLHCRVLKKCFVCMM